jgi:hypothetical protein
VLDYEAMVARLDKLDEYSAILKELQKVSRAERAGGSGGFFAGNCQTTEERIR